MLDEFSKYNFPLWGFFLLLAIYLIGAYFVRISSSSTRIVFLMGQPLPLRSLTGAFSSIFNLCIVLMVVIYKKPGLIVSLIALATQYVPIVIGLIHGDATVITGFFVTSFIIVTVLLLYKYIAKMEKSQEKMRNLAVTDRLTGLPNRFAVSELSDARIKKNEPFAVAIVSLNNFKGISNALGQQVGDQILIQVGKRWQSLADSGKTGTKDLVEIT